MKLEYKCYPMWIYGEDGEFIDNDLVEELQDDNEVDVILTSIQDAYDRLFEDNKLVFRYKGFKNEKEKKQFIMRIQSAINLIKSKVGNKYIIENCIEL